MADRNRFGALSLGLTQIRRQLSSQPAVVFALFIAVLVSAFLLGSTPRLLEAVSSEDLAATVSDPPAANRNIAIERVGRFAPGPPDDPLRRIVTFGDQFESNEVPESVQGIISDSYSLFETPQFSIGPLPGDDPPHPFDMFLRFTHHEGIEDEMSLLEGRLPREREPVPFLVGSACPLDPDAYLAVFEFLEESDEPLTDDEGNFVDCQIGEVSHYEVVVSPATAEALGVDIDQQMLLTPDPSDSLFFGLSLEELGYGLVMSISGIVEFSAPDLEYWYGRTDLHRPRIQENADLRIIFAKGVVDPSIYPDLFADMGAASLRYTYREFVSPALVQDADLDVLVSDLREFQSIWTPVVAAPTRPRVITQLPQLLDDHLAQRTETVAVMSTTVATLMVVAVSVILLLATLMTTRQRSSLVYSRNRGASRSQMVLTRIYEGVVLVAPAAILGHLIADLAFDDSDDLMPYRLVVALTVAAIVVIVASSWHPTTAPLGRLQRFNIYRPPPSARRMVSEILVITLAAGSVILLRRRGSIQDQPPGATFDWLLAAAPALLSISAALVTVWVFPLIIRAISWLAAQLRGLVGFIGFRRLLNRAGGGPMAIAVTLICVAAAVFASIAGNSVERGQVVSSYQAVGADFVVTANARHANLPADVDLSAQGGIEASALGTSFALARLQRDVTDISTEVLAIDAADYVSVRADTEGDFSLPRSVTGIPRPGEGTEEVPMPAVVAEAWPAGFQPRLGEVYMVDLGRIRFAIEVVDLRERFPSLPAGRPFVVFNRESLENFSDLPVAATAQYLKAADPTEDSLTEVLSEQSNTAQLTSRYEILRTFEADPFVDWIDRGFRTVFIFAGILAVVAAISSLALASSQRRIDFAYLKTLGLNNRQATLLTVFEQLPIVLSATAVGAIAGVGVALALDPAVKLDSFTGNLVPTSLVIDWSSIVLLAIAVFVALSTAIVIFVLATRHQDIGQTLRVGDE